MIFNHRTIYKKKLKSFLNLNKGGHGSKVCTDSEDKKIPGYSVNCEVNEFFGRFILALNVFLVVMINSVTFVRVYKKKSRKNFLTTRC